MSGCEALAIGYRLGAAIRRQDELEEKEADAREGGEESAAHYLHDAVNHATDQVMALRRALTVARATSLAGSAIQMAEAATLVELVADESADKRALERIIYATIGVLVDHAKGDVAEVVTPGFLSLNLDPWVDVEDRLAAVRDNPS